RDLNLPVIVVVGSKLGALNHALLTLDCAHNRGLHLLGYIVNHPTPHTDEAIRTNAATLRQLTDVPCLGIIPFLSLDTNIPSDRTRLGKIFTQAIDLPQLLR
ncbi:MAG: ATP-dependent dethiobiotin synthetase BioD, partial [Candidatus Binatia bacterium]